MRRFALTLAALLLTLAGVLLVLAPPLHAQPDASQSNARPHLEELPAYRVVN